jgi:3-oxoacyl-[acyl-carrier-protein] synthase II
LTPVGNTVEESWKNIVAGKSGIAPITAFDASDFSARISGSVKNFDATEYILAKDIKKMDTFIHFGIAAGIQALDDSGLEVTEENAERIGVAIGSGIGGLPSIEKNRDAFVAGGPRKISPFFVPSSLINMVSGNLSIMRGLKGPNISIVSACTTGAHNIGDAARMISYGDADIMVAGASEMATSALGVGGFAAARALSTRNDDPEAASRPWDRDRDGFVLGDGAGVIVLEEYEMAKKRGANIYCELVGYGMSGDAYHMTSPSQGGEGASRCMLNAMNDAGLNAQDIDYINAHGTSTPAGDIAETNAVKLALGDHAYKTLISSTKSMTGHLLGAAGGIETIFSILALRDQVVPPTINLENQDPECDLDFVANTARQANLKVTMSNSFGFGGTNGTCIFKLI